MFNLSTMMVSFAIYLLLGLSYPDVQVVSNIKSDMYHKL